MTLEAAHFVFEVSRCQAHEVCWLYRLAPHKLNDEGSPALASDDKLRCLLLRGGVNLKGLCCRGGDHWLVTHIPRLSAYIQLSLQKCAEQPRLSQFRLSFRNQLLSWRPTDEAFYKSLVSLNTPKNDSASHWAAYVLFAALSEYLSASPEGDSIARVYAAWQRYSLIKLLYNQKKPKGDETDRAIITEFDIAYRALATLLLDEANSYACHLLWLTRLTAKEKTNDELPHPQVRERLRLSMFVKRAGSESQPTVLPMPAPGCFEDDKRLGHDGSDRLHLRFQTSGKAANHSRRGGDITLHRFISDELLPQYNLTDALELSRLTRFGEDVSPKWFDRLSKKLKLYGGSSEQRWGRLGWGLRWLLPMLVSAVFLVTVFILFSCVFGWSFLTGSAVEWEMFGVMITSILIPLIGWVAVGLRNAITLSLPRVLGGIVIGYFPLIVAEEPWYLAVYASQHPQVWTVEWLAVSLMVWGYLRREAFPFVLSSGEARGRSFKVFAWATVLAVMLGFWLCLLAAPIYRQVEFNTLRVEQSKTWVVPPAPCSCPSATTTSDGRSISEGLAYCVKVPLPRGAKLPVSALLTFAPIALLLGIILQILWEEKTVTASVWPSESR